jgi:hypothetical protein
MRQARNNMRVGILGSGLMGGELDPELQEDDSGRDRGCPVEGHRGFGSLPGAQLDGKAADWMEHVSDEQYNG